MIAETWLNANQKCGL